MTVTSLDGSKLQWLVSDTDVLAHDYWPHRFLRVSSSGFWSSHGCYDDGRVA